MDYFSQYRSNVTRDRSNRCLIANTAVFKACVLTLGVITLTACGSDFNADGQSGFGTGTSTSTSTSTSTATSTGTSTGTGTQTSAIPDAGQFVIAAPSRISIQNVGGVNSGILAFQVVGSGLPVAGEPVSFRLVAASTKLGATIINETQNGVTNAEGFAFVEVKSGNAPGPITVQMELDNYAIAPVQSVDFAAEGGPPMSGKFSVLANIYNPDAFKIDGESIVVTGTVADRFGHPAPDGTIIAFTAETGILIPPSCATEDGRCSVAWTSTVAEVDGLIAPVLDPPPLNPLLTTILGTVVGTEEYTETGSIPNQFDDADTFIDIGDFYRDDRAVSDLEANTYVQTRADEAEYRVDQTGAALGVLEEAGDGLYNGVNCDPNSVSCSQENNEVILSRAIVIALSAGRAFPPQFTDGNAPNSIAFGNSTAPSVFFVEASDINGNALPCGAEFGLSTDFGTGSISGEDVSCLTTSPQRAVFTLRPDPIPRESRSGSAFVFIDNGSGTTSQIEIPISQIGALEPGSTSE